MKCYVVIDHMAIGHPYQTIWNTLKVFLLYSYSNLIDKEVLVISQYEYDILVITRVRGEAEDE